MPRASLGGMMSGAFSFLLFSVDPSFVAAAVAAGVDSVVVDWESAGKEARQAGADTEINGHSVADLERVRGATSARVICRINGVHDRTPGEVEDAIAAGADEILVPMVRTPRDVDRVLNAVQDRCGVGILIETTAAVACARALAALPLTRIYVGLNDLSIERGTPNLFTAVADGTVERLRDAVGPVRFGFGGLTLPELGRPIPCRLLYAEMARLACDFSFLRRSFVADVRERDLRVEVPRMRGAIIAARARQSAEVIRDRQALLAAIDCWTPIAASGEALLRG